MRWFRYSTPNLDHQRFVIKPKTLNICLISIFELTIPSKFDNPRKRFAKTLLHG